MMAISVVMRSETLIRQINTVNYCLKMIFEETFRDQEAAKFHAGAGPPYRTGRRDLADRADRERVRICGLAFRFGLRPLAARLPDCHADDCAGRHRGLDPPRASSERHAERVE